MLLTKSTTFIIGPVATLLGYIMNGIFWVQSQIGIESIGLCIILFTIVIYMLLMPLTIKQQKFSKLQSKMNPELQAIQKKYKDKRQDQAAMMKMNEETQAVYQKYGVNPMGSCLQLIIQMPILFALYRVIWNIPAYVGTVKNAFLPLAQALMNVSGAQDFMAEIASKNAVSFKEMTELTLIDVLYKFKPENWSALLKQFPDLSSLITSTQGDVDDYCRTACPGAFRADTVAQYQADVHAERYTADLRRRSGYDGSDDEVHECDDADYVCRILFHTSGRYGYLLDHRCGGSKHPAAGCKQAHRQDGSG